MKNLLFTSVVCLFVFALIAQDKKPLPKNHCLGITKKGDSCRTVPKEGKHCRWHDPNSIKCAKQGCNMLVPRKGEYCIYHLR